MPPTPIEQDRAWALVTALVENGKSPRDANNDENWEKLFNRALQLSVLYSTVVSNFP